MNPQPPMRWTRLTPQQALRALLASGVLLAALPIAAAPTLAACSWNQPGYNPFTGDPVAAVDRYQDIAPLVRARLKARMARRAYDEIVTIGRDAIVGKARYGAEIRDMHFGAAQVCRTVDRSAWAANARERGLVYCEDGQCILVPTVCRNVSRIRRVAGDDATVADASDTAPVAGGGSGGGGGGGDGATPSAGLAAGGSAPASWAALAAAEPATVRPAALDTLYSGIQRTVAALPADSPAAGRPVQAGNTVLLDAITPGVPEPGGLALWPAALLLLGWRVRRARKAGACDPTASAPSRSCP